MTVLLSYQLSSHKERDNKVNRADGDADGGKEPLESENTNLFVIHIHQFCLLFYDFVTQSYSIFIIANAFLEKKSYINIFTTTSGFNLPSSWQF